MNTVLEYLVEQDSAFEERPFGVVDAMALSVLSMIDAGPLSSRFPLALGSLTVSEQAPSPPKDFNPHLVEQLAELVSSSRRFSEALVVDYLNLQEQGETTQFAAYTLKFNNDFLFVVFRGTDTTFEGWQESLYLAVEYPTAAQQAALDYLEETVRKFPNYPLVISGHSKGGNLAVYAAMEATSATRSHIAHIYNFDGPGFLPGSAAEENYIRVQDLVEKFVPEESIFGMFLETNTDYQIIKSQGKGVEQHDLFTWEIEDGQLVPAEALNPSTTTFNAVVDQWVRGLTKNEREVAIGAIYEAAVATGAKTALDILAESPFEFLTLASSALKNTSPESKKILGAAVRKLVAIAVAQTRKKILPDSK